MAKKKGNKVTRFKLVQWADDDGMLTLRRSVEEDFCKVHNRREAMEILSALGAREVQDVLYGYAWEKTEAPE